MDIFAHTLWTNIVFYKKLQNERKQRLFAVLFGILPDLISFSPVFLYAFFTRIEFFDLVGSKVWVVRYASESYNYTHSVIIFSLACIIVALFRRYTLKIHDREKLMYWPMFGWALHIFIDIFTHKGFYETPFLFPLSGFKFSYGISWGHPVFMIINYSILAGVYLFWFLVIRKNYGNQR
jgi:membrane-bound metal-dependent hydrolase YbcI (DUF457 family)